MSFSYKPLWKILIDREMMKKDLMSATGISKSTLDKMYRKEKISMDIIDRLCNYLHCDIGDIVEHCPDGEQNTLVTSIPQSHVEANDFLVS